MVWRNEANVIALRVVISTQLHCPVATFKPKSAPNKSQESPTKKECVLCVFSFGQIKKAKQ